MKRTRLIIHSPDIEVHTALPEHCRLEIFRDQHGLHVQNFHTPMPFRMVVATTQPFNLEFKRQKEAHT